MAVRAIGLFSIARWKMEDGRWRRLKVWHDPSRMLLRARGHIAYCIAAGLLTRVVARSAQVDSSRLYEQIRSIELCKMSGEGAYKDDFGFL